MNRITITRLVVFVFGVAILASPAAGALDTATQSPTTKTTTQTAAQAQRLQAIQAKGSQEIDCRLATLTGLSAKIASAAKVTSGDKIALTNEVTTEQTGLTALRVKLNDDRRSASGRANDYQWL